MRAWLLALLLLLAACAEPVPADHAAYVGEWRGNGITLSIFADGRAEYEKVRGGSRVSINGPVHSFRADGFKIGLGPLSADFQVSQPPQARDGVWSMVVDGETLSRAGVAVEAPSETIGLWR